jgi:small-conductance mechanosensitive channel
MAFFTRLILALFGMAFAALFAVCVLFWLVLFATFASVRWLFTGKKPQVVVMLRQIQTIRKGMQTSQRTRWFSWSQSSDGQWHEAHGQTQRKDFKADVVEDAVVREVHEQRHLPKD